MSPADSGAPGARDTRESGEVAHRPSRASTRARPVPVTLELCLPPDERAPGAARHAVSGIHPYLGPAVRDTLELLVSELVTNSILHAGLLETDWVSLEVSRHGRAVRVVVRDPGPGIDTARDVHDPEPGGLGGWGLVLVDRLASRWGVKTGDVAEVWFELDLVEPPDQGQR